MQDPIVTISSSPVRRMFSIGILMLLGGMLIYLAFAVPLASVARQIGLIVIGIGVLILGDKLRRSTALSIVLSESGISDSSGRQLCRMEDIAGIDRGAFAIKPANGFMLRTKNPLGRHWSPGLWWRFGRRIGVGGATSCSESKMMAEVIAMRLAQD